MIQKLVPCIVMTINIVEISLSFIFGACIGSFLNVVIWRVPRNISIVIPRSYCPKCDITISWYENIPLISWLIQSGKCRWCKKKISSIYPFVECVQTVAPG